MEKRFFFSVSVWCVGVVVCCERVSTPRKVREQMRRQRVRAPGATMQERIIETNAPRVARSLLAEQALTEQAEHQRRGARLLHRLCVWGEELHLPLWRVRVNLRLVVCNLGLL